MSRTQTDKLDVVGHQWAIELLQKQHQAGHFPQALLLAGPLQVGKATLGRYLARVLNCQGASKPCGTCLSCHKLVSGNHPDVRIFDQEDEAIKIDQIRELQRELALSPLESQYRVALLCNFERATTSAANALLKTLEEPTEQVILILTATDPSQLLPTIVSRCQVLTLRPLPQREILEALQTRWGLFGKRAELLSQLAAGRLGWAVRAMADEAFLARRERRLNELLELLRTGRAERLDYAQEFSRDAGAIKEILGLWLAIWRDLLLLQSGSHTKLINLDWRDTLEPLAAQMTIGQTKEMVVRVRTALLNLERNVNPRLNLEVVLLKLPVC